MTQHATTWLALAMGIAAATFGPGTMAAAQPAPQPNLVKLVPADMAASKTFTVAVALGSPPDDFHDEKGEIVGWEIDILRAATEATGLRIDLRPTTFDALMRAFKIVGGADVVGVGSGLTGRGLAWCRSWCGG
jgi:polar amino acid transport system substrate-binding protein